LEQTNWPYSNSFGNPTESFSSIISQPATIVHRTLRRNLHWVGSALALTGVGFVAQRLSHYAAGADFSRFSATSWLFVSGVCLAYALAGLMLACGWRNVVGHLGTTISTRAAVGIYGVAQLAKYVPGNVLHLAGRQALGIAAGIPGWTLAKSAVWELALLATAAAGFGLLTLPLLEPACPMALSLGAFAALIGLAAGLAKHLIGPRVARAFAWYTVFLGISGLIFVALLTIVRDPPMDGSLPWLPVCGAYVLAWLGGLVTPGAPAGIGVRELALLFLLKGLVSEEDLVVAILLGRIVTVSGDIFFCLFASFISRRP